MYRKLNALIGNEYEPLLAVVIGLVSLPSTGQAVQFVPLLLTLTVVATPVIVGNWKLPRLAPSVSYVVDVVPPLAIVNAVYVPWLIESSPKEIARPPQTDGLAHENQN